MCSTPKRRTSCYFPEVIYRKAGHHKAKLTSCAPEMPGRPNFQKRLIPKGGYSRVTQPSESLIGVPRRGVFQYRLQFKIVLRETIVLYILSRFRQLLHHKAYHQETSSCSFSFLPALPQKNITLLSKTRFRENSHMELNGKKQTKKETSRSR